MNPRPLLSRRTTLVTGLGATGLAAVTGAGCSVRVPGSASPSTSPTPSPGQLEPDVQLVVELVTALRQSVALLKDTRTRYPKLGPRVSPLIAVQNRHLAVLRQAVPADSLSADQPTTPAVLPRGPQALGQVLTTTEGLRDQCYSCALRAESGRFAQLLAGMGAGLSQRLVVVRAAG